MSSAIAWTALAINGTQSLVICLVAVVRRRSRRAEYRREHTKHLRQLAADGIEMPGLTDRPLPGDRWPYNLKLYLWGVVVERLPSRWLTDRFVARYNAALDAYPYWPIDPTGRLYTTGGQEGTGAASAGRGANPELPDV